MASISYHEHKAWGRSALSASNSILFHPQPIRTYFFKYIRICIYTRARPRFCFKTVRESRSRRTDISTLQLIGGTVVLFSSNAHSLANILRIRHCIHSRIRYIHSHR